MAIFSALWSFLLLAVGASAQEYYPYDLSTYSVRFERCQDVKMFDDELAAQGEDPMALKHFVAFRLCPACDSCSSNYGKYVTDVETYLQYTVENQRRGLEYMCENCAEECEGDACTGCGKTCYEIQNMEANGYVDASQYIQCQQLGGNNNEGEGEQEQGGEQDAADDDASAIYIGPRCSDNGQRIIIGLFSDAYCEEPMSDMTVQEALGGAPLSYHLLGHVGSASSTQSCLSCKENGDANDNQNDQNDADDVNEICEGLYDAAAKCETYTGIQYGFMQTARQNGQDENQLETEFMSCTFIDSILMNSYTEEGEINVKDPQDEIIRHMTKLQGIVLCLLIPTVGGLLFLIRYYNRKNDEAGKGSPLIAAGSLT